VNPFEILQGGLDDRTGSGTTGRYELSVPPVGFWVIDYLALDCTFTGVATRRGMVSIIRQGNVEAAIAVTRNSFDDGSAPSFTFANTGAPESTLANEFKFVVPCPHIALQSGWIIRYSTISGAAADEYANFQFQLRRVG
jgi:hypothetical protein